LWTCYRNINDVLYCPRCFKPSLTCSHKMMHWLISLLTIKSHETINLFYFISGDVWVTIWFRPTNLHLFLLILFQITETKCQSPKNIKRSFTVIRLIHILTWSNPKLYLKDGTLRGSRYISFKYDLTSKILKIL